MSTLDAALEELVRRVVREELAVASGGAASGAPPGLVTIAEYARVRSVSPSNVRKAIREGRLAAVRVGRAVRVRADAELGTAAARRDDESPGARALAILAGGRR